MEVDVVDVRAMGLGFGRGQVVEDGFSQRPGAVGHGAAGQNLFDLSQGAVHVAVMVIVIAVVMAVIVVMIMMMMAVVVMTAAVEISHIVIVIVQRRVEHHVEIAGVDAGDGSAADFDGVAGKRQAVQRLHQHGAVGAEIEHRADGHVSGNAGAAFKVKLFRHKCPSFRNRYRLYCNNFINWWKMAQLVYLF